MPKAFPETYDTGNTQVLKGFPRLSMSMRAGAKVESTGVGEDLRFNRDYLKSRFAAINVAQILIGLICLCCASPSRTWYAILFTFVAAIAFAVTITIFFCTMVTMRNVLFPTFNWGIAELLYVIFGTLLYFGTSVLLLCLSNREADKYLLKRREYYTGYILAAVFGLLNSVMYAVNTYMIIKERKEAENAVSPLSDSH